MTYEEFKGELFRIIMQQEEVRGRRIMLLEKGYTTRDGQILSMIRYINRVTSGREDSVMHGDYIQVIWGEGNIRSMMSWDVREYYTRFRREGWQGILPELLARIQRAGLSEIWLRPGGEGYEQMKDRLIIRPINYFLNRYELEDGYFWKIGDIALTLYGVLYDGEDDYLTLKLKKGMTVGWNVPEEELLQNALCNTAALMPPRLYFSSDLRSRHDPEEGIFLPGEGESVTCALNPDNGMEGALGYRLTTTKIINGAVAIFYPGVKERLGELLGDYYIGFTSIHEAILHPAASQSPLCMRESIHEINATFPREEMLSSRIYQYSRETKELLEVG